MRRILLIFTGGTICSCPTGKDNKNQSNARMMVGSWNDLLKIFRRKELTNECEGVIVLHGTDTFAYNAALLSLALVGFKKPVCMVSAQLNLHNPKSNGYTNFRASVELIMNGIKPNMYVVYRNLLDKDHTPW